MHIVVTGNIGAGKTTLTELLARYYSWTPYYEDVDENPYLDDFYTNMQRWSFNLQVYFLNSRFSQLLEIQNSSGSAIQDRSIYEDAYIFAPNLHAMGLMETRDFETYYSLFKHVVSLVKPPDLLIYLRASVPTLVRQIQRRGRTYEEGIRIDYLKKLNERYEDWISSYDSGRLLIIDVDVTQFSEHQEYLSEIIDKVNAELHGLF